jgi:hypothetical protein
MANQVTYGFYDLQSVFDQRVTEVGVNVIRSAIDATVAEHNRQMDAFLSLFVRRTTQFKQIFRTATVASLQPLDQNGRARPIQTAGQYETAFPLMDAGTAWGANYKTRVKMTVEEANDITATLIMADIRWMRYHILGALYDNVGWTYADPEHGNLSVVGLANGDTVTYQIMAGTDAGATDTHYLFQNAAIDDSNDPFPTIQAELAEHPENTGEIVAFIPTNRKASVQALTAFYPAADPNIDLGASQARLVGNLGVALAGGVEESAERLHHCCLHRWRATYRHARGTRSRVARIPSGGRAGRSSVLGAAIPAHGWFWRLEQGWSRRTPHGQRRIHRSAQWLRNAL